MARNYYIPSPLREELVAGARVSLGLPALVTWTRGGESESTHTFQVVLTNGETFDVRQMANPVNRKRPYWTLTASGVGAPANLTRLGSWPAVRGFLDGYCYSLNKLS